MIKFSLPGYYHQKDILLFFAFLQKDKPEMFISNRRFDSAYDFPPTLIWNGGRSFNEHKFDPCIQHWLLDDYEYGNIALRHTCTNQLLTSEHFSDTLCNNWVARSEKENNGVIVYSEEFANYIRTKYPKYNIIYSTTRNQTDLNVINTLSKHNLVVLNYNKNHDSAYLASLQHPENIEILCAEQCIANCPNRQYHYELISKAQFGLPFTEKESQFWCPYNKESPNLSFYESLTMPHAITTEYIDELYNKLGICNFKISGRKASPIFLIEAICYYLIKPEYRDFVRHIALINSFYPNH